jgi:uroporphyrin-3 C-methyltransferase
MPTLTNELPAESRSTPRAPGRFTTVCAVLALAAAIYSVFRIDATTDRLDTVREGMRTLESSQTATRAELSSLAARATQSDQDLQQRLGEIAKMPQQLGDLQGSLEELRGRADRPQRAWARAEALFLLELADRRLKLDRDPGTAVVALQAADAQLAELHEAGLAAVRTQLANEIQALQAVPRPDLTGIEARLEHAEDNASRLQVAGIVLGRDNGGRAAPLPDNGVMRAWEVIKHSLSGLVTVRHLAGPADTLVTVEQETLRRQHLQLLLYSARQALLRRDTTAYRASMQGAVDWLKQYFAADDANVGAMIQTLEPLARVDISPPLPDISASVQLLERSLPGKEPA